MEEEKGLQRKWWELWKEQKIKRLRRKKDLNLLSCFAASATALMFASQFLVAGEEPVDLETVSCRQKPHNRTWSACCCTVREKKTYLVSDSSIESDRSLYL